MKRTFVTSKAVTFVTLLFLLTLTLKAYATESPPMDNIRLNQVGYYPDSRKVAVFIHSSDKTAPTEFLVVSLPDNKVVLRGKPSEVLEWAESGEKGQRVDFSELKAPGKYKLVILGNVRHKSESHPFVVSERAYKDVATAAMRAFYFQRCSSPLRQQFAGKWARNTGHKDNAVAFHPSSGHWDGDGTLSSPGGWYDAGDFGKYMVNSGITVGTLLAFYENYPEYFADKTLNIPESGNGWPDILDEVKWNLDWMKTMQDKDGGVFFKLTTLTFPGYIMPEEDRGQRFIIGKSTTSALNFAATMAQAGRVYMPLDSTYAKNCVERAVRAWDWATKNPNAVFRNPEDVKTGEYRDATFNDEFVWAAAELFITTADKRYSDYLKENDLSYKGEPSWQNVHSLAALSLSTVKSKLDAQAVEAIRKSVVKTADRWIGEMDKHLYRIPNTNFIWGSNSNFANMGVGMVYAYKITKDKKYLLAAAEIGDYLLGKNAVGQSFVTAFGTKAASNPHHRHMVAAKLGPIPGFLVGGPNVGHQDSVHGVTYSSTLPAKSYEDAYKSYASNEVAINWNAPLTFLFGALDAIMQPKPPKPQPKPQDAAAPPAPAPKPQEQKPAEPKPAEPKPQGAAAPTPASVPKPQEQKPAEPKPAEPKPQGTAAPAPAPAPKPQEQKPAEPKPQGAAAPAPAPKPQEQKPAEPKPAEPKPQGAAAPAPAPKPQEQKPAEPKPAEPKPQGAAAPAPAPKPQEQKPAESKPVEPKPAEPKPQGAATPPAPKPQEPKPAEPKPQESKPQEKPQ